MSEAQAHAELLDALRFYRDGFTFHPKRSRTGIDLSEWKPTEALLDDCGERARAALEHATTKSTKTWLVRPYEGTVWLSTTEQPTDELRRWFEFKSPDEATP